MHIAVCDDNVADRKQLERLLGRESDKRSHTSGVFYTDSFGNPEHLLQNPMIYNVFFIDVVQGDRNGLELAKQMVAKGITAPIILCSSKIDYQAGLAEAADQYPTIRHLQKPILVAELSKALDYAVAQQEFIEPTIELRGEQETCYAKEDEIVSATMKGNLLYVLLRDGRKIPVRTEFDNFFSQIACYSHFAETSPKAFVNVSYIKKLGMFSVTLKDGSSFKISPSLIPYVKGVYREYLEEK